MSGSGISWAICKSAPRSRQITMPAPYHSCILYHCLYFVYCNWCCLHSTWSRVYVTVTRPSVCQSVCHIDQQQQRQPIGLLLSALRVGLDRQLQAPTLSRKCGKRHVESRRRRLNFFYHAAFRPIVQLHAEQCSKRCKISLTYTNLSCIYTRLPSVVFRSWSRFLAVSLQVTWVINPAVGCHYFPPGPQLPLQPIRGLLPVSLLGEQRHDGCEQFA